ncbi:hypothetical protein [Haloarcula sp. JP-L23]|uniref:hypothetical protein n=1 Tax=Haloarcula sp. JP-L23 TaxID=2716717 RepID=UPI00140F4268|nr:hypothetical protein G9465_18755 [Haloarcula sp. JP-L23]
MQALGDVITSSLSTWLESLLDSVAEGFEKGAEAIIGEIVKTPAPNRVFGPPTNNAWPQIYEYYWEELMPIVLFLYGISIGLVIFLESTSHLFSSYHRTKLKKRAFSGLLGILAWWWIAALSLQLVDGFAAFLVPDLSDVSLFESLSFGAMGLLGLLVTYTVDLILFVLIGLIYFTRQVMLYLFVLLMPILIVFWIPGVGPFSLVSRFMSRLAGFYAPFLFMTIPVALLFRLGQLLGSSFQFTVDGIALWFVALIIPFVAVIAPLLMFWQAGAIFVFGERASHHASAQRARQRFATTAEGAQTAVQGTQNFTRGVRGEPAIRRDGQTVLGSGDSRAHAGGQRVRETTVSLRDRVRADSSDSTASQQSSEGGGDSRNQREEDDSRATDFSAMRDRDAGSSSDSTDSNRSRDSETANETDRSDDERPWYIN